MYKNPIFDVYSLFFPIMSELIAHQKFLSQFNMKLPNGINAVDNIVKLRDYCLSPQHPEGRRKVRGFLSALGMSSAEAESMREILISAALVNNGVSMNGVDQYGNRYSFDLAVQWGSREALLRSAWIIKTGANFPRLVRCYVLRDAESKHWK
jgi:hypothetical protein